MAKSGGNTSGLRPLYSFDQLVVGPHNHVANAACHEVANKPGEAYNPLFIYGPSGVGKTHLMHATAHEILKKNPEFRVRYISAERFVSEILMAISEDKVLVLRKDYSELDLLIIDDVQYLCESKMSQDELFHIFNNLQQEGRQVILAADRPPNQLTALNKSIRSRLEWGLATDVSIPAEPTRFEILKRKQDAQGLKLSDEMLNYVAKNLQSNVRELEGFLKRIHAYVTLSHQEISVELVQAVLKEIMPEGHVGAYEQEEPVRSVDKSVKAEANARHAKSEEVPLKEPKAKEKEPISALSEPMVLSPAPSAQEDSFDLMIDSMSMGVPPAPPLTQENGKNGHHKPAARSAASTPADVSLPPPALPSSAPSNLSFDILLESMNINAPEAPTKKPAASPPPPPPAPAAPAPPAKVVVPPPTPVPPAKVAVPPPAPKPISIPQPEEADSLASNDGTDVEDNAPGQKEVSVVFFYPEGCKEALQTVQKKFQEVIKKHKLKFRMKFVHNEPYSFKGKINYASFVDVCKANKVPVTVVIGPPPDTFIPEQDFYDLLTVTLDVQGVSLQLVNWGEINKDYRYLNLALDIALVRAR